MRREIEMPRLSDATEEGVLVTWFVEPGAAVREGDLVAEVQVEKVASEIHAPAAGRIGELLAEPGGVVRQGTAIAILETEGDVAPAPAGTGGAGGLASPAARRLARELGVDLTAVTGSGPGGRIVEVDVRAAGSAAGAPTVLVVGRTEPVSSMRRAIADRLRAGLASTAQLTLTAEADVTILAGRLEDWSAAWGRRASFTEATVGAVALALREHPRLAARWEGERLAHPERIDVGVAVALDDGLIVPVVRDADRKDLSTLGREIAELADRARLGALVPSETEGACFSVTNLGGHRIDAFTPLLNPPQTAILGIGRARIRPAVFDGTIVPRTLVVLSLTFDHQVVDGAPAAAFLDAVAELLEAPDRLPVPAPPAAGALARPRDP
jgi:pyruvate/2-oxoglutarate dehydrogenase complex dihydrolipoamide acyltransferase (E2) component